MNVNKELISKAALDSIWCQLFHTMKISGCELSVAEVLARRFATPVLTPVLTTLVPLKGSE